MKHPNFILIKIKLLVLLTIVSFSCYSQSIGELKIPQVVSLNPIKVQFTVYQEDTVAMYLYNIMGQIVLNIVPKDLYKVGTYKIEYTFTDSLPTNSYHYILASSNKKNLGSIYFNHFKGSSASKDFINITYIESLKIYDTIKTSIVDTTSILIVDTLNCIKTSTNLTNYHPLLASNGYTFHDNLAIDFYGGEYLTLYDLSGKFIRRTPVNGNLINLQDLMNGFYVGLFYENGEIIKAIKLIKE